jgi:carbonic anhydrase
MHRGEQVLEELIEGNRRFRAGKSTHWCYDGTSLAALAEAPAPRAAVICCSDSRVPPEVIFDQPLGSLFVSRVPGNVASDGVKWMIEIAVGEFHVPLLVVCGHTGCLAVGQIVQGKTMGAGGDLRLHILSSMFIAQKSKPEDLWHATVVENAHHTIEMLAQHSRQFRAAISADELVAATVLYEVQTGEASVLAVDRHEVQRH